MDQDLRNILDKEVLTIFLKNMEVSSVSGEIIMIRSKITNPDEIEKIVAASIRFKIDVQSESI